ncbi:diaminopimelate decarboxylase [Crocinitomicaceae bacterium CZZ-1]|uniref:Diaminopimelate decarboxylase n=1 Tax=Taishania pollutisoli TaxID=2766479 RepID=A0A8J6PLL0_9FLAO|nr:diaminopimelate decarboxylase [Taishania pollutisoli]MBC9813919.1 diaminopimelate decarboxylase [Taishania pollutisoli]
MFDPNLTRQLEGVETPFYYYDLDLLKRTLETVKAAAEKRNFHIHYAYKANYNERILHWINAYGFGADCVSGNEVKKAIEIGVHPDKIAFAGVGKTDKEIRYALQQEIFSFNVESPEELLVIGELAVQEQRTARIALRINPNVDAQTHHYITTGLDENKFGIMPGDLPECIAVAKANPYLELHGIHFHIGSQILEMNVFKSLCIKVNEWNRWFEEHGIYLRTLNVGGGLGVDYKQPDEFPLPDFDAYFSVFEQFLEKRPNQEVHFEIGRAIVAQCGTLISKALYIKKGIKKHFVILDAGMTELMRPALYQAYHAIENISAKTGAVQLHYDIVGPICESSDSFGKEVLLPEVHRGDLLAIRTAGAYGEVMSSRYNLRDEIRHYFKETD